MNIYIPYRYLSKETIENVALTVLQNLDTSLVNGLSWPIDPTQVAEYLGLDTEIIDLPYEGEDAIAAMIWPTEYKILINEHSDQLPKGFQESSIAHEIGHWVLHVNQQKVKEYATHRELGQQVTQPPALHRIYRPKEQYNIEWQAQYFAGCLLMPRFKLEKARKGRNLTKWQHLYAICDELGVTISNLTHRLQDLEWIYIPKNSKQIYHGKIS